MYKALFSVVILFAACTLPQKTVSKKPISTKYILTSDFGHKIEVEIEYSLAGTGYMNNGCRAQYIATNIGEKDLITNEQFKKGYRIMNTARLDSMYGTPGFIFEFRTSDGKLIEERSPLFNDLRVGKSTEAREIHIGAGNRICTGVRPIQIRYKYVGDAINQ